MNASPVDKSTPLRGKAPGGPLPVAYRAGAPVLALLAFGAEVALAAAGLLGLAGAIFVAVGHMLVLAALAVAMVITARRGNDTGPLLLLLPAVAFAGPFGAFGGIIIGRLSRRGREDVERLEAWYRRIALSTELDPTARLADHVLTGRSLDVARDAPASITDLIANGTIAEKQTILGLIARRFHPDYLPGLQRALVAEEPIIRVQAAAVAAKIRGELPVYVEQLLREASDAALPPDRVVQLIGDARRCVASGLVEAKDQERATRLIDGLLARTLLRIEKRGHRTPAALDGAAVDAFEDHLLTTRRYGEFRRLRRTRLWSRRGPWTWRPLTRSVKRQAVAS